MRALLRPRTRVALALGAVAVVLALIGIAIAWRWAQAPPDPEVPAMTLKPCPDSPNCVSSLDTDETHAIAPLTFDGPAPLAAAAALRALGRLPRTRVTVVSEHPLHATATCRSLIFRFVDDVELRMDVGASRIDVRSASRTGYSDLGVNRRRVERLRELFREELGRP